MSNKRKCVEEELLFISLITMGCLENSDLENSDHPLGVSKTQTLKTQTLWELFRPEKLRPSGCLENSDPKDKIDSECQRMLQAVLFTTSIPECTLKRLIGCRLSQKKKKLALLSILGCCVHKPSEPKRCPTSFIFVM